MITRTLSVLCIAACLATACSGGPSDSSMPTADASSSPGSLVSSAIDHALDKASAKIASHNITISSDDGNAPKAEITPQGDFLIAGKPVQLTPSQRREMLAYRRLMLGIAQQGITVGKKGAELGLGAASAAIAGALSGESDEQIRQRVEAKTSGIRQAAANICDRLPEVMASQQQLAADLPAFKPYADMTQADIDECREDAMNTD